MQYTAPLIYSVRPSHAEILKTLSEARRLRNVASATRDLTSTTVERSVELLKMIRDQQWARGNISGVLATPIVETQD